MNALKSLAVAAAAAVALIAASPGVDAQGPRGGGPPDGGGSFRAAPPPSGGGSFRGAPPPSGGGTYRTAPRHGHPVHDHYHGGARVTFGFYAPGYWWGPGYWPGYWWGPGYWGPRYGYVYPPYYDYYYAPGYVAPPPVYIEREPPAEPPAPVWWYWCAEAKAYYPYVKECPGGWQRVPPQPAPPPRQ